MWLDTPFIEINLCFLFLTYPCYVFVKIFFFLFGYQTVPAFYNYYNLNVNLCISVSHIGAPLILQYSLFLFSNFIWIKFIIVFFIKPSATKFTVGNTGSKRKCFIIRCKLCSSFPPRNKRLSFIALQF